MTCYIFGAGAFNGAPPVLSDGDLLIAADAGLLTLRRLGLTPDLVIGDFDSLGSVPDCPDVIRLPVVKDETDTAAALREGERRGYRRFVLLGCTGGRPDHTYANQQILAGLAERGIRAFLPGDGYTAFAISCETAFFPAGCRGILSVFCVSGEARGVTECGLQYSLHDANLSDGIPLGVSNRFTGEPSSVAVREGTLLLFAEGENPDYPVTFS